MIGGIACVMFDVFVALWFSAALIYIYKVHYLFFRAGLRVSVDVCFGVWGVLKLFFSIRVRRTFCRLY